jgi:hypothetical protein
MLVRLRAAGLTAKVEKCELIQPSIEFLGHTVSTIGLAPLPDRVATMAAHQHPTNIKQLQNFLRIIKFYGKFVPGAASILLPLADARKGSPKPKAAVKWTRDHRDAFQAAMAALRKATILAYPKVGAEMALMVDKSTDHIGAALKQRDAATTAWQPLGSSPRSWTPPRGGTWPMTESCWPESRELGTSSCWRAGPSRSTPTISCSPLPCPRRRRNGLPARADT